MKRFALVVALLMFAIPAAAADYPTREIEIVVSFPAGGPADTSARIIAPKLRRCWASPS